MKKTIIASALIISSLGLAGCGAESNVEAPKTTTVAKTEQGAKFQEGVEYLRLEKPVAEFKGKIVEFYWYSCVHCLSVEEKVSSLNIANGREVIIQRHSQLFDQAEEVAKFDYALRGLLPEKAQELNHEIMVLANTGKIDGIGDIYDFLAKHGLSRATVDEYLSKPEVVERMAEMKKIELSGKFRGTPSFLIDGQFVLNYDEVSNWSEAFEIMDYIAKTKMQK
ncbi:hypothetical protein [Vibrio owensii]|uniref:hypothetical protein n=1 Tax=Vibrio owensii TaxID=696485 RepID=UPI003CC66CA5